MFLLQAAAVADATHRILRSAADLASVLLQTTEAGLVILASGRWSAVRAHPAAASAERIERPSSLLLPGLINAHTHLDLTTLGPRPFEPGASFVSWVNMIRADRPTEPEAISYAIERGVSLSRAGGVVAVGDIAGAVRGAPSAIAALALAQSGLSGVSFVEFFAIGRTESERLAQLEAVCADLSRLERLPTSMHRFGIQPHAPNTVSPSAYGAACKTAERLGLPVMTHLAESADERRFVTTATGPQRSLLDGLDLWTPALDTVFGLGRSPVEHLEAVLRDHPITAVHVNDCSDDDLDRLERTGTPVVYCPRASDYFGAPLHFGQHRYQDMLDRGITVALGTDSIINLPPETDRLSTLDEMRYLIGRDGTDPIRLLEMATTHAASILGLPGESVQIRQGAAPLGIIAVPIESDRSDADPLDAVLHQANAPEILFERNRSGLPRI